VETAQSQSQTRPQPPGYQSKNQVSKRSTVMSKVFQAQPSQVIAAEKKFISSINPRNKISLKSVEQLQRERERGGAVNNSNTNRSNNKASSNRKFKENKSKERKTPQQTKQVKWVSTKEVYEV
jgi:hypothetical protein